MLISSIPAQVSQQAHMETATHQDNCNVETQALSLLLSTAEKEMMNKLDCQTGNPLGNWKTGK